MLKGTTDLRTHIKLINQAFPNLRNKLAGVYVKLYTDNMDMHAKLIDFLELNIIPFYVITPKDKRPIKVVIKGIPKESKVEHVLSDLTELGFPDAKVSQLIGRITKEKLPVFMGTLPRNINNAKIFDIKTVGYLSVRMEGYDGKGVSQCYSCNLFNHTAENCHLTPRCLKCGQPHQTKNCTIQRAENTFCINCQAYGHMANYAKCPKFPKPRKGKNIKNNYTTVIDSLIRPNVSYSQALNPNNSNTNNIKTPSTDGTTTI
ncbi:nucleic-acid-binding protein from transposon X-element [Trichonephila clavata]|uniref:Nucleic-acid-binding protein from transposon X-element n=1 Tax=Trichonephila clavata TaxID=2740835 RepID=A0A8X6HYT1_TRICU|nr:nucleic-acid-binding protein from transposon X-element [Trichonephila clavata]